MLSLNKQVCRSSLTFNVNENTTHKEQHPLYRTEAVFDGSKFVKTTFGYMTVLFISIGWMPFLVSTLYNADLLFAIEKLFFLTIYALKFNRVQRFAQSLLVFIDANYFIL